MQPVHGQGDNLIIWIYLLQIGVHVIASLLTYDLIGIRAACMCTHESTNQCVANFACLCK